MSIPLPWQRPNLAMALKVSVEQLAILLGDADKPGPEEDEHLEVVSAVMAWGVSVPSGAVWPELRHGEPSVHQQPWTATRTLKELSTFVRCDMLTRRETLTQAVKAVSGPALVAPITGWFDILPGSLEPRDHGTHRIGAGDVEALERSTRFFAATDADLGGALSREAAVGQLKYAVDLARHANYSQATGDRLLAVIAELSGLVGWLSHDSGMAGPAQKYFTHGLQAARESADPRAPLLVVSILADMAQQMRWLDRMKAAMQLYDLAIGQIPADRRRFNVVRALLTAKRVQDSICHLGPAYVSEVRSALGQSFELYAQADDEDRATAATLWHRALDMSEAELSNAAAGSCLSAARDDPSLAIKAEEYTVAQLAKTGEGRGRDRVFGQIRLARLRLLAGEAEQACDDGEKALQLAGPVNSAMIRTTLRWLLTESEPYGNVPRVAEFQERLRTALGS